MEWVLYDKDLRHERIKFLKFWNDFKNLPTLIVPVAKHLLKVNKTKIL